MRLLPFLTVSLLAACLPCVAQPTISEFLTENSSGITDLDGETSDWIEIYNPSTEPINLSGWSLTDDAGLLNKWVMPDITLPASGYLVIFASGKDRNDPEEELHTNFSLNSSGEYLALVDPDGSTIAKEFNYGEKF